MSQDVNDFRPENERGEFQTTDNLWRGDIAGNSRDEQIAKALIEDDFDGDARVGATQEDREWRLQRRDFLQSLQVSVRREGFTSDETLVTFRKGKQNFIRRLRPPDKGLTFFGRIAAGRIAALWG
jgi:hypothetical protein